jgi:heme oxygenase
METLRSETQEQHRKLQASPYVVALEAGSVKPVSYAGYLRSLAVVHGSLEHELSLAGHAAVASVWRAEMAATDLLERDLAFFQARLLPDVPAALDEALGLAASIRRRRVSDPVSLLGYLYVLEGSRLGAPGVRAAAGRALGLTGPDGLEYLTVRGGAPQAWKSFGARMDAAVEDEATAARVVAAARELFEGLLGVFRALEPVTETRFTVSMLNAEAGSHPVPQDPREMCAAVRAGEEAWGEFPYLERRFGARGKRFTRSDSAWLATLAALEPDRVSQQVRWLGGVLAARGMPRLLLQRHLEILARELEREIPAQRARYQKLAAAARELDEARHAVIPRDVAAALAARFEASPGADGEDRIAGAGELLVAAVQDEKAGVPGAVESLVRWLGDPSRASPACVLAVGATVAAARAVSTGA